MRGDSTDPEPVFSYITTAQRVPQDHPLRQVRAMADEALQGALTASSSELYSTTGRPSIPPERLLRALLLQYLYGVRSERLLMEQLDYNLLFRWFVGLGVDDRVWDATTFTKNRERLLNGDLAVQFLESVVAAARAEGLTSDEHFSVDGTLIEAWAGRRVSSAKGSGTTSRGPEVGVGTQNVDFRGERRRSDTHPSTTDPDARLVPQGEGAEVEAQLPGPCGDREPERSGGGSRGHAGDGASGTRGGAVVAGGSAAAPASDGGRVIAGTTCPALLRPCGTRVSRRTLRRRSRAARSTLARPDTRAIG